MKLPRGADFWWGLLLVAAGGALGRAAQAPVAGAVVGALATVLALVVAGHQLRRPWAALVVVALAGVVLGAPAALVVRVTAAVLAGGLAAVAAALGGQVPGRRITLADGIYGVGFMILLSALFTTMVPVPGGSLAGARLSTILILYLITPPLEAMAVLLVLVHGARLSAFIRSNYGAHAGLGREVGQGIGVGLAIVLLSSLLVRAETSVFRMPVQPNNPFVFDPHAAAAAAPLVGLMVVAVVVLAPLAEEALFRGLLFGGLESRWGLWPAAALSAAVFGAAHLNVSLWLPLSTAGLLLALVYARTRSLWASTAAHATLNGVSVLLALMVR